MEREGPIRPTPSRSLGVRSLRRLAVAGVVLPWLWLTLSACGQVSPSEAAPDAIDGAEPPGPDTRDVLEDAAPADMGVADAAGAADALDALDAGPPCPTGQLRGLDGACFPVGIQGCAAIFLDERGLCDPSMDRCPPGTIPKFDEGCAPVGIQGCAALFLEDDGLCHPSLSKCPPGTIPKFDEGCATVGIQGCAGAFLEDDGLCHPSMDACPDGAFAVPTEGCVPIDGPDGCGDGTWGNVADGPDTFYVDPAYAGDDGDGSRERPGRTIAAVLALVPEGGRLVLAAGDYDEPLHLTTGVELIGRCPSLVTVSGVQDVEEPVIVWVDQAIGATLRGLEITGDGVGVRATNASGLTIEWVRIREATGVGVSVLGGVDVRLDHVLVTGTRADEAGDPGRGVDVQGGSRVTLTRSALVGNRDAGLGVAGDGTEVEAAGNLVADTRPRTVDGNFGDGVRVRSGARATLTGNAVVGNHHAGLAVEEERTVVELTGNVVEGTRPRTIDGEYGWGVRVDDGARLTAVGNAVVGNSNVGVALAGLETWVEARGNLVRGTLRRAPDGVGGGGVVVQYGAWAALDDNAIVGNGPFGVEVVGDFDVGAETWATGNLIEDTRVEDEAFCGGVLVADRSRATLSGNALVSNACVGLAIGGRATETDATGNLIAATEPGTAAGGGVLVYDGAVASLTGNAVLANHDYGLAVIDSADVEAAGNLVATTTPSDDLMLSGFGGVTIGFGGQARISYGAILGNQGGGLLVAHAGTRVDVWTSLVEGTLPSENTGEGGMGVLAQSPSSVTLTDCAIRESHLAALVAFSGAAPRVSFCRLSDTRKGRFTLADGSTRTGLGDGLLTFGGDVELTDTIVEGCERAGVVFDSSRGRIERTVSRDNEYGLVLQGAPSPGVGEGNLFTGNATLDVEWHGMLAVPGEPSPLPRIPRPSP